MTESSGQTGMESSGRRRDPGTSRSTADFLYDAFYGGAVSGSVLALFVLIVDAVVKEPLFAPSLLGTVLFTDEAAAATMAVRIDMVAYFTVVHFLAFLLAGAGMSLLYTGIGPSRGRPLLLGVVAFTVMTLGFVAAAALFMPGVVGILGLGWIMLGNLLASVAMVAFLGWAHAQSRASRTT